MRHLRALLLAALLGAACAAPERTTVPPSTPEPSPSVAVSVSATPPVPPTASAASPPPPPEPPSIDLGTFELRFEQPVISLALGEPRVAVLAAEPFMLENGTWKKLAIPDRLSLGAGVKASIFFGRDDRPRIMGTRSRSGAPSQLYLRFRDGAWKEEGAEIGKLHDAPKEGLFGVLGHADPEVVCKVGGDCLVKRRTGWKTMPAGPGSPRVELHSGLAWAIHPDSVARLLDDNRWATLNPPTPPKDIGGVWGTMVEAWISEPSTGRLLHFHQGLWTVELAPFAEPRGMWGSARDDVWLAGATGLAHYDGSRWSRVRGPKGPLSQVLGRGREVWAAGDAGVWAR